MQRSVSELDSTFEAFVATRSQRAAADKMAGAEATAKTPDGSYQPMNSGSSSKSQGGGGLAGKEASTSGAPGISALKGLGGGKKRPKRKTTTLNAFQKSSWSATRRRIHSFFAKR